MTIENYIWLLFVALAASANAVMDVCKDHYSTSIFKTYNPYFWNTEISWLNKYKNRAVKQGRTNVPVQFTDSWHLFKSLMIISIAFAVMFAAMYYKPFYSYFECIIEFGLVWNGTFNLFYNHILVKK